ncbi:MAG: nickel insertion protein [Pirellulaceae bacterium]
MKLASDSIVDIVGVAIALSQVQIRRIVAAPPPTGTGTIRIAHGLVSVPAPATAELLRGIPLQGSSIASWRHLLVRLS